jgi:hypothetical protein
MMFLYRLFVYRLKRGAHHDPSQHFAYFVDQQRFDTIGA